MNTYDGLGNYYNSSSFVEEDLMINNIVDFNPGNRKDDFDENFGRQNNVQNRFNNNDDLLDLLLNDDDSSYSDSESSDSCPNPTCNHSENEDNSKVSLSFKDKPKELLHINDLIELGKLYHCKKRREYYGLDLKILCNLVSPLTEMNRLIGMNKIKQQLVNQILFFLQGFNKIEKCGNCINCIYDKKCINKSNNDMMHTVITGPPGVGKTELGKILGKVYKAMGALSKGTFHIASRPDLIGKYLGHTAAKTQAFIDKCKGGVMFIDEAYSLGNPEGRDSFSKECIDTINQNLTERRDFLCIIAGYKNDLDKCFFQYNAGLRRRFSFQYDIDGYTAEELTKIFLVKINKEGWNSEFEADEHKKNYLENFFRENMRYFPNFGGDVETLFLNCKIHHGRRVLFNDPNLRKLITIHDVEKGFATFIENRKYKENTIKSKEAMQARMMYF